MPYRHVQHAPAVYLISVFGVVGLAWGWPSRTIDRADIEGAAPVRNSWWHGWGIRKVSRGWMYNNAGRDAVELLAAITS